MLRYKIIALLYTLGLTFISLTPLKQIHLPNFSFGDKIVHLLMYFFMAILWLLAFPKFRKYKTIYILIIIMWGIIIEFLQSYMNIGRTGDPFDALANSIGVVLGLLVFEKIITKYLLVQ